MHASTRLLKRWKIDQKTMHEKVVASYDQLAKANQFRIIPVGEAIDIARKLPVISPAVNSVNSLVSSGFTSAIAVIAATQRILWFQD